MQTVNTRAAQTHLSRLVDAAAAGEKTLITRAPVDFKAPLPEAVLDALEGR